MFGIANEGGRRQGMKQAAASLPFTARSLTRDQVRALVSTELTWISTSVAVLIAVALTMFAFIEIDRALWPLLGGFGAFLLLVCAFRAVWKVRHGAGYVDPLVRIDVGDTGIEIHRSGVHEGKSYAELAVTDILVNSSEGNVSFLGIVLETSSGPLRLGNDWFDGGNAAAGAILRRMDQLGVTLRLRGGIMS